MPFKDTKAGQTSYYAEELCECGGAVVVCGDTETCERCAWIEQVRLLSESTELVQKVTTEWLKQIYERILSQQERIAELEKRVEERDKSNNLIIDTLQSQLARMKDFARVVEDLAGNEGESRIEFNHDTDPPTVKSDDVLDKLYSFAHVVRRGKVCDDKHADWEKELDDYIKALTEGD